MMSDSHQEATPGVMAELAPHPVDAGVGLSLSADTGRARGARGEVMGRGWEHGYAVHIQKSTGMHIRSIYIYIYI